jgi:membrane fusion protein, multidrug efflux system
MHRAAMTTSASPSTGTRIEDERKTRQASIPWMKLAIIAVVVVLAAAATYWYLVLRFEQTTDDAYVGGDVTVMAPKVAGFVDKIEVTDNQRVKAGQILVRLDSRDYDAQLAKSIAEVDSARAAIAELESRRVLQSAIIAQRAAEKNAAAAELTRAALDKTRYRTLVQDDAVSAQLVERADSDYSKAQAGVARTDAGVSAAQREIDVIDAQLKDAQARVETALAAERLAELNVEYTTIRCPVDGYVGNRTGRVGMLAKVGVPLLTIVPSSGLWIDANFKEDQLKKMRDGDLVDVSLDASSKSFHGRVESLAPATGATFSVLPPENATGNFTKIVQRVPVRVHLDAQPGLDKVLRPGLSAVVTVHTGR